LINRYATDRRPALEGRSPEPGDVSTTGDGDDRRATQTTTDPLEKEPLVSTQIPSRPLPSPDRRESPWASGLTVVAATFLVIAGVWHALAGIAGIVRDDVYVATPQYLYSFDLTVWGWVHLLLGALQVVAGFAVLKGQMWARVVGIVAACLSMLANFAFIPHYPLWSLLIIALDVGIIWALATYRREAL
jgi:hypothetical protein